MNRNIETAEATTIDIKPKVGCVGVAAVFDEFLIQHACSRGAARDDKHDAKPREQPLVEDVRGFPGATWRHGGQGHANTQQRESKPLKRGQGSSEDLVISVKIR